MLSSLDPRINRLSIPEEIPSLEPKGDLDQLETYEVFLQIREGNPFRHVGIVHAANEEFAFLFAKEQYSRRLTCSGIWIAKTSAVRTTEITEGDQSIYQKVTQPENPGTEPGEYDLFLLQKRGKQCVHAGSLQASGYEDALWQSKAEVPEEEVILCVWIVKSEDVYRSDPDDVAIWATLPEKKYRDAIDYKASEKINQFKAEKEKS